MTMDQLFEGELPEGKIIELTSYSGKGVSRLKQKLVFKMTNFEHGISVTCTHTYIGRWQAEGFTVTGYAVISPYVSVMDINPEDIPNNILGDNEND